MTEKPWTTLTSAIAIASMAAVVKTEPVVILIVPKVSLDQDGAGWTAQGPLDIRMKGLVPDANGRIILRAICAHILQELDSSD